MNCKDCNKEFETEANVNECLECYEPICDNCKENHNCVCDEKDFSDVENVVCTECGSIEETMNDCDSCNDVLCNGCTESHIEKHRSEIEFEESTCEDYVTNKSAEKL